MTMTIEKMAAQGDVLFRRVKRVPDGYEALPATVEIVVAHSETGHHHKVPGLHATHYAQRADPMVSYLQLGDAEALEVTHHRPYDTHAPIRLGGGAGAVWEVRRQREHTPEGWRRVQD
jgi:hypothetical protein